MELLLRVDVPSLGRAGQLVNVKPGYGRNYLLPKRLATHMSQENLRVIEKDKKKREELESKKVAEFKTLAGKLSQTNSTIEAKMAEGGHLYGSVTTANIAQALKKQGFEIEESAIHLENPIKEKGNFTITIRLHSGVETTTQITVVEEKSK